MKSWFSSLCSGTRLRIRLPARVLCILMTLSAWAHAAVSLAQPPGQPAAAPTGGKSYVVPYFVVVLCIALGLLVVCRSGGRSNEPKIEKLE